MSLSNIEKRKQDALDKVMSRRKSWNDRLFWGEVFELVKLAKSSKDLLIRILDAHQLSFEEVMRLRDKEFLLTFSACPDITLNWLKAFRMAAKQKFPPEETINNPEEDVEKIGQQQNDSTSLMPSSTPGSAAEGTTTVTQQQKNSTSLLGTSTPMSAADLFCIHDLAHPPSTSFQNIPPIFSKN